MFTSIVIFSFLLVQTSCAPVESSEDEHVEALMRTSRAATFGQNGISATSAGDPYCTSLDGIKFEFQGYCHYLFCAPCKGPIKGWWNVEIENKPVTRNGKLYAYTDHCEIAIYNHFVSLEVNGNVKIDGVDHSESDLMMHGPTQMHDGRVEVGSLGYGQGSYLRSNELAFNVTHSNRGNNGRHVATMSLMSSDPYLRDLKVYHGNLCGLCGNFDGNKINDLIPNGSDEISDPVEVANSWMTNKQECGL